MPGRLIAASTLLAAMLLGCGQQPVPRVEGTNRPEEHVVQRPVIAEPAAGVGATTLAPQKVELGSSKLLAGIPGQGPLTVAEVQAWLDDPANQAPLEIELPMSLEPGALQVKDLKDRPMTRAKIELGRQLFFDKRLSADNTVSCASCHEPEKGYTIDAPLATGIKNQKGRRNPPTLLNRVMLSLGHDKQFWDGRSSSVEDGLLHAISDPTEMAGSPDATVARLKGIDGYRLEFDRIYGGVSWDAIGESVGCFVRNLVTGPAPFDYYRAWERYKDTGQDWLDEDPALAARYREAKSGVETDPMSESAKRGEDLFFRGKASWCSACHNGVNLTDELYHNIGVGLDAAKPDPGRFGVTQKAEDWGAFKTPTIRGAIHTAPYMHDGSIATLEGVVEWYAQEGRANRNLDYRYKRIGGAKLTKQEKADLVAFIRACSGSLPKVATGRLPE